MSSPYKKFAEKQALKETLRRVENLRTGKMYKLYNIKQIQSKFQRNGKYPVNLVVYYEDCGLKFFTYLPSDFDDHDPASVEEIVKDIQTGKPPSICYYGHVGSGNHVILHPHGEGINDELLHELEKQTNQNSPFKEASDESAPSKKMKIEEEDPKN